MVGSYAICKTEVWEHWYPNSALERWGKYGDYRFILIVHWGEPYPTKYEQAYSLN